MEPSRMRLTRDPLARLMGTMDGAANAVVAAPAVDVEPVVEPSVADDPVGRPDGTTKSMDRFVAPDQLDPQNMDVEDDEFRPELFSKFRPSNADRTNDLVGLL